MTIEPFDKHAQRYDGWFDKNKFIYKSEFFALEKLIPKEREGIEIGVGSGRFAHPLGIKVGIDPSKEMAKIAKKRGINVFEGHAEDIPIKDSKFDFALMVTTICFLNDVIRSFREVYRILKNDGLIIVGLIDRESYLGELYQKKKKDNVFYKHAKFYSVDEVVLILEKVGFSFFKFIQTLFGDIKDIQNPKKGYGDGSFVVISAKK